MAGKNKIKKQKRKEETRGRKKNSIGLFFSSLVFFSVLFLLCSLSPPFSPFSP
jgi:hypothetical protein